MTPEEISDIRQKTAALIRIDENGCWIWQGKPDAHGYGNMEWRCLRDKAHRWAYRAFMGPIPADLELDHLCRIKTCVNPEHLEAVTHRENILRGTSPSAINAKKTRCKHGHDLAPGNTRVTSLGQRRCLKCEYLRGVKRRSKKNGEEP